jgi:hypothetical protein
MKLGGLDVVYILGKGSQWRNNELRYSLRSLKNLPHRNVYIIGYLPKFIRADRVKHIPAEDPTSNKIINSIHKHSIACQTEGISEDFILMNDDIFIMKPTEVIPRWYRKTLKESIEAHPTHDGYYHQSLVLTDQVLQLKNIPKPLDYSVHSPIVFNKKKLTEVLEVCQKFKPNALLIKTVYGNYFWRKSELHIDVKASHERHLEELQAEPFLSITDNLTLRTGFKFWIDRQFPVASYHEIETIQDDMEAEEATYTAPNGADIEGNYYAPGTIIRNKKISPEVILAQGLKVCH